MNILAITVSVFVSFLIYVSSITTDTKTISIDDAVAKLERILNKRLPRHEFYPRDYANPKCRGKRERKEVRQMSERKWNKFTKAVNALKEKGIYDQIAEIHRGTRINGSHSGAAFLPWHRIYLLIFEEQLRREEPCVTIPYWDSTLDYQTTDPKRSVLWTDTFVGNGNYKVNSGPFAFWITGTGGNLTRNIGNSGTLISKENVLNVLSRTNHSQIMDTHKPEYNLEMIQDGPHVWVDGQMKLINEAAEDPVFFLHLAFIDCIWYWFQEMIFNRYGIDSYDDYPNVTGLHGPNMKMDPFTGITNRDGYHRSFYNGLYTCKPMPKCSGYNNGCGSKYLTCDVHHKRCLTKLVSSSARSQVSGPPPGIRRGTTFTSVFQDNRTSGNPLPQTLPDITKFAETTKELVQKLYLNITSVTP